MAIYKNLETLRKLSNASLTSIIDVTNLNFKSLSDANLEFLNNIKYDETNNIISLVKGTFTFIDVSNLFRLVSDGVPMFTIDSQGRAEGQQFLVKVAEAKRYRHTDFPDWPDIGIPGEIIYTGIQNQRPEFGEDFIGYLHGRGWVSLTKGGGGTSGFIKLEELYGSPPTPPTPGNGFGILWIGPPGYETAYNPTTQTVYYTDENNQTYDILSDFVWEKQGINAKFKLSGKVIIGDNVTLGQFQFVDGNQQVGYVLTSDANGSATWQPATGGGGPANSAYVEITNFTAEVTKTITHSLSTDSVHVQLIDLTLNELIDAYISNYQTNSVDVTLSSTKSNIKVIVLAAGGTIGSGTGGHILQDEGVSLPQRAKLDFVGAAVTVTDDAINNKTIVTIPSGGIYTKSSPTTITVGGLPAGSPILGMSIEDILEDILVPYISPAFTSFVISGQATTVEVGSTVSGVKLFTWGISTPANVQSNTVAIKDLTTVTDLITGSANDGSESLNIGSFTNNVPASHSWQARATNTQLSVFNSSIFTVNWRYQIFYGPTAVTPTNSANTRSLPSSRFTDAGNVFILNTGSIEKIFAVAMPATMSLVSVIDLDALNANITANYIMTTFTVNDAGANPVAYKIYIMTNAVPYPSNHRHQITVS